MKRYIQWIVDHRLTVIVLALLVTVLAGYEARHLKVIINMNATLPQSHPYIATTNHIEKVFGSKYMVVIGVTPSEGDIYQPALLAKVQRITAGLRAAKGVVAENLLSLSARRAKNIAGTDDGLQVMPLLGSASPPSATSVSAMRAALPKNPAYSNVIVSDDARTTAIVAEFKEPGAEGFRGILEQVEGIVAKERDASVSILVGGQPGYLAGLETYSERMVYLLPAAILILGLVLFSAFRSLQGVFLPLTTSLLAVIWAVGVMGACDIPMDVFNATTPILILAVATGHAVQVLKRYYEEYFRLRSTNSMAPSEANRGAVVEALSRVGPVMLVAGSVASLGFFSLLVFEISTVRVFGIFTGIGILAAMVLEMSFIPALRSMLSPPRAAEAPSQGRLWAGAAGAIAWCVTSHRRRWLYAGVAAFVAFFAVGIGRTEIDNSIKSFFAPGERVAVEDQGLNQRLGGTNTLYVLLTGDAKDAIKRPEVLHAIDDLQGFLAKQPNVGKTLSIADFVKRMNQAMHNDDPAYFAIPDDPELVSQYLLLYSLSGEPGDFNAYADYDYREANLTIFLKTDSSAYMDLLLGKVKSHLAAHPVPGVTLSYGGSVTLSAALSDVMVRGKILNILQIGVVVFFVTMIIFRSVLAGLLVLLPLVIAVLTNFGLMGWFGIPLNVPTSLTSAMAVGIGADYAIYLLYRLREELDKGTEAVAAVNKVVRTAGQAVLFVAVAVATGYGVLLFSFGFNVHKWLAILIGVAMLVSALAALLLIPALTLSLRPNFLFGRPRTKTAVGAPKMHSDLALVVLVAGLALWGRPAKAESMDLIQIMEKNFVVTKVDDAVFESTFTLINKDGQERVRKTAGKTKLATNRRDTMRVTRFVGPPDVKGTSSLLIEHAEGDDDIWIYLPALKKVRRLVSNNKRDAFLGTDFSYGDVIGHKVADWHYKLLREEEVDKQPTYVIESVPASSDVQSSSGYSKRTEWIRKDNYVTVKAENLDEQGQLLTTSKYSDLKLVDPQRNKWQAMRLEASNAQTAHRTVITFDSFKVNQHVSDDDFTPRSMTSE